MEHREIEAPVAEVTVMEDRARVVRRARVELGEGAHRLTVTGVAPVLADKSLSARVGGAPAHDARVHRTTVYAREHAPEAIRAIDQEIETLDAERARLGARITRLDAELASLTRIGDLAVNETMDDAAWSRGDGDAWRARVTEPIAREREARRTRLDMALGLEETHRKLSALRARRTVETTPRTTREARVQVDVVVAEAGVHTIEIDYVVPGACWRPAHTARLDDAHVEWSAEGCVWQNTGEDWNDVTLLFSTERPSLGVEPPALTPDILAVQRRGPLVVETRQQEVQTAGLGAEKRVVAELPGIDDGGEALHLTANAKATVPSDGRPWRVTLHTFVAEAKTELVCMAELAPAVLLKSVQVNGAPYPLLAGPVDLVRKSGRVGRTKVGFVARRERFELGWGPEASLRVLRETRMLDPETSLMSAWTTNTTHVTLRLSNLGADACTVQLIERVVVSEIEKVKVTVDAEATTSGKQPDADGFVRWDVALAPFGHEQVELRHRMKRHSDVVG